MCASDLSPFQNIDDGLQALAIPIEQRAAILADVRAKADASRQARIVGDDRDAALARRIHRTRLMGNALMGGRIMSDPKFEMLLELFVAEHEGERRSVSDLCFSADAPQTTGLRHIEKLEQDGFVRREPDPRDRRRWWVEPTGRAIAGVSAYLKELQRKQ